MSISRELREVLEDPERHFWGGPWEHLGDAERDVLKLLDECDRYKQALKDIAEMDIQGFAYRPVKRAREELAKDGG